jgi:outer membrane biosynthesis protein TonB
MTSNADNSSGRRGGGDGDAGDPAHARLFGLERSLVWALLVSLTLHAAFLVVASQLRPPELEFEIDVRESRGVALLTEIGFAPPSAEVVPEVTVEEEAEPPQQEEQPEGSGGGAEGEDAEPDGGDGDDQPTEPEAPTEPEESEDAPTAPVTDPEGEPGGPPAPEPEPEPEPEPGTTSEGEDGGGEGSADTPPDPSTLPPARRYPEGTLNPVATDVGMWGPEGAASVAIIRADRIRRSDHRDALEGIFSGLADYSDLSRNTSIDIIEDVDALLLASTNVTDWQKTFIAAVHHLDPVYLMAELRRGYPSGVVWEERSGRYWGTPGAATTLRRRFLIPTQELLIFSPQEFLDPLTEGAPRPRGLPEQFDPESVRARPPETVEEILVELGLPESRPEPYTTDGDPCEGRAAIGLARCRDRVRERRAEAERAIAAYDAQREELLPAAQAEHERQQTAWEDSRLNGRSNRTDDRPPVRADESWIGGLLEVGDLAGAGRDGPAILWTFSGFDAFRLGGMRPGTDPPQSLHASLTLDDDPLLQARFVFGSREQAEAFSSQWSGVVDHYTFPLTAAGLLRAFRTGEWEIDHNEAILTVDVPASSLSRLSLAMGMLGGG